MESNENTSEDVKVEDDITDFWKRSHYELLKRDKIDQIKEAAKAIRAKNEAEGITYDEEKVAAIAAQIDETFFKEKTSQTFKTVKAFHALLEMVRADTHNKSQSLGLELLEIFKTHYLPTVKDYSPVTKARWRKENAKAGQPDTKEVKADEAEEKAKRENRAKRILEKKTVAFLLEKAVDAHFKQLDDAEKKLPIDKQTHNIIKSARQILATIDEEDKKAVKVLDELYDEVKTKNDKDIIKNEINKFFDRKGAENLHTNEDFIKALGTLIKHAPSNVSEDDLDSFTALMKAASLDDDFEFIVHNDDDEEDED